ncbi:hypothetical protein GQ457_15G021560 [Hibiscus cannabinus]
MAFPTRILLFLTLTSIPTDDEKLTADQALQQYDFSVGILHIGVIGYDLSEETGEFTGYLSGTCNFAIDSYQLSYKSAIQGVISLRRIRNVKGVSVKVLFFWLNIVEVIHDGGELKFSVGLASANFLVDNFYESPQYDCGFDCNLLDTFLSSAAELIAGVVPTLFIFSTRGVSRFLGKSF